MKIPIINNDREHTRKIEDGVSLLQLLSFSGGADSKIELHASKSRGEALKKSSCLDLIECLGENISFLSNANIDFFLFFQAVPYGGNTYRFYIDAWINIYDYQKTESSMTLLIPTLNTQVILQIHYQCYYYIHCPHQYHQFLFRIMDDSLLVNLISYKANVV